MSNFASSDSTSPSTGSTPPSTGSNPDEIYWSNEAIRERGYDPRTGKKMVDDTGSSTGSSVGSSVSNISSMLSKINSNGQYQAITNMQEMIELFENNDIGDVDYFEI